MLAGEMTHARLNWVYNDNSFMLHWSETQPVRNENVLALAHG